MLASPRLFLILSLTAACTASDLDRLSAGYGRVATNGGGDGGGSGGAAGGAGAGNTGGGGAAGTSGGAGTGGGGTAGKGSAGKGAGAGAGGSAGVSSACDGSMASCTGCELCAQASGGPCAAETAACATNPECGALQDCQNKCVDPMCATKCDEAHPSGVMTYSAFDTCRVAACSQACSSKPVCTGLAKTITSTCFSNTPCNPVTNVGCSAAAGETCDFDGTQFKCFGPPPPNVVPVCGACDVKACLPGYYCRPTTAGGTSPKCFAYCCVDADCGATGRCSTAPGFPGGGCVTK